MSMTSDIAGSSASAIDARAHEIDVSQRLAAAPECVRHGLLEVGRNCTAIRRADRFAVLIDGEAYFSSLREALTRAQRTIFIVGWDINSRIRLVPDGANDGFPEPLGEFLQALGALRRHLRIYILAWDFAMIYALEREVAQSFA